MQNQTIDEITAVQSVNQMYGVTGQILTNTYLVKDATLTEVRDLLNLSSDPDVTGQVINDVTSVLSGLGDSCRVWVRSCNSHRTRIR